MKFPYGICDFYKIITQGYFFIDRTDRIPLIEKAGQHLLFLRPRRFGKSLLLSILENYYDVAKAKEFERLFSHLSIGKNPTPDHNRYLIMNWDFSAVNPQGTPDQIQQSLHNHLNGCIEHFIVRYRDILDYHIVLDENDAMRSFQSVLSAVESSPWKLYLLIDEYDNFANEVMMGQHPESRKRYESLLYGEGALKTVFKVVKYATKGMGLDRAFITGVSPVVMSDVTSGHNIAENICMEEEFNDLCGFRESEIAETLEQIRTDCDLPKENTAEALEMMRKFYNGYCFSYENPQYVYNPTLALYFMKAFRKKCRYPEEMLDENLAMDRGKIAYISKLPNGGDVIRDALNEADLPDIQRLARRFGVADMLQESKDRTFMISLLWYFGMLTFGGRKATGKLAMKIPNLLVRGLYIEKLREAALPEGKQDEALHIAETFYHRGDMAQLCEFIEQGYFRAFDKRDYRWSNELTVKTLFLTLLFNDLYYITDSETDLEREYADFTMILRPDMRKYELLNFLIEFKYVSLKESELGGEEIRKKSSSELKMLPPVQKKMAEAKSKLEKYRKILSESYGEVLRLRVFSVTAIGFEKLVWEELG